MLGFSCSPRGRFCRFLPLVTAVVLLSGCGSSSPNTAPFPEFGKPSKITKSIPKAPPKGTDRVGSEAASQ